jgi:hypothetical protein
MRTITDDDVGIGPIDILSPDIIRSTADLASAGNVTRALDGRRERNELNPKGSNTPLGRLVNAVDSGRVSAANDNTPRTPQVRYHLKEMFERGELGTNEPENRVHWFDAERLKKTLSVAKIDDLDDSAAREWRELMPMFLEGFGGLIESIDSDNGISLSDDLEFEDTNGVPAECRVVDNADDTPDAIRILYASQVISLAAEVLGRDFALLRAVIDHNWTTQMIGESEGFTGRATASACGKGMLRAALRNLSRFYIGLDRLEERGERPQDIWPLIGTQNWPPVVYPPTIRWQHGHYLNQARGPVIKVAA